MASTSSSAEFYDRFKTLKTNVNGSIEVSDLTSASRELSTLKMELRGAVGELPAYDQRSYDLQIRELEDRLKVSRPVTKSKFNFTSTSKRAPASQASGVSSTSTSTTGSGSVAGARVEAAVPLQSAQAQDSGPSSERTERPERERGSAVIGGISSPSPNVGASSSTPTSTSTPSSSRVIRYESRSNEWLHLPPTESSTSSLQDDTVYGSSVILENLTRCIIDLRPPSPPSSSAPSSHTSPTSPKRTETQIENQTQTQTQTVITSIHAKGLSGCILLAEVGGSVMFSDVHDSMLVLKCHQFRTHDSRNTIVLLDIPSHPIIEHSTNISFGPHPQTTLSSDINASQPSQLDQVGQTGQGPKSRHLEVHDFGWIKEGPSPNWHPLHTELHSRILKGLDTLTLPSNGSTGHRDQEVRSKELGEIIDSVLNGIEG